MDTPDLRGTMAAFNRVLKPGGVAVLVFSHPCFPQGVATASEDGGEVCYRWSFPYFESRTCSDPPWAHFTSEFIWFHRPLSDYWKAFRRQGLSWSTLRNPDLQSVITSRKPLEGLGIARPVPIR